MHIGQLMRGLLGEARPDGGKALELKGGQIVRGVLLQAVDELEALVQINGVQVRARLDIPMTTGRTTLLQVQPQSEDGLLHLKPIGLQEAEAPDETLKDWAKAMGLPADRQWALDLASEVRSRQGSSLQEAAASFRLAAAAMPQGENAITWMQAAGLAYSRGLPMTATVVSALRQVEAGPPLHELLDVLEAKLDDWRNSAAREEERSVAQPSGSFRLAAEKLKNLLIEDGEALLRAVSGDRALADGRLPTGEQAGSGAGEAGSAVLPGNAPAAFAARGGAQSQTATGPSDARTSAHAGQARAVPDGSVASQNGGEPVAPRALRGTPETAAGLGAVNAEHGQARDSGGWPAQILKWLGVDHERLLARAVTESAAKRAVDPPAADSPIDSSREDARHAGTAQPPADEQAERITGDATRGGPQPRYAAGPVSAAVHSSGSEPPRLEAESLKNSLMTLASDADVPPALKDAAEQLVRHITGQQLMLAPERTGGLFTYVAMFIPMRGEDGARTASVHIQTRRGRKGELDADNCRLLFDLRLKSLGDTVAEVQVVDKIVSVNLWNNHPAVADLMEASRDEMAESLRRAGYQLSSLRTTPFAERSREEPQGGVLQVLPSADFRARSSKPYKGVDYRI
ncbi:flagellar hook-length control protein FliK [Paenibacillus humicola]|uniref:flagellar hook-length control protein FliK n=1 Tax=Paenibacillus humicola TaxID=3110540 RepID=UPI00237BC79F|nr:flagellar hook-length control protein FliK [Paenibacillus humicola]